MAKRNFTDEQLQQLKERLTSAEELKGKELTKEEIEQVNTDYEKYLVDMDRETARKKAEIQAMNDPMMPHEKANIAKG
jgi:hypothetical protein